MASKTLSIGAHAAGVRRLITAVLALALCAAAARACTIPVFRYALERWPADPYTLLICHDGPLSEDQESVVRWLEEASIESGGPANLSIEITDLSVAQDRRKDLTRPSEIADGPWMELHYPGYDFAAWEAPLDAESAHAVVDSPLRREISRRILEGETAVWILVECGDAALDEGAADLLQATLTKAGEEIQLMQPQPGDPAYDPAWDLESPLELKVAFSLIRLRRDDPAERVMTSLLLRTERGLATGDQPVAFPVFGRARSLPPLIGKGISERNIMDACGFLVGWCSCQVKALNPGIDLPVSTDWDTGLVERVVPEPRLPELLPGMSGTVLPEASLPVEMPPATTQPDPLAGAAEPPLAATRLVLVSAGAVAVALAVLAFAATRRQSERRP